MKIGLITHHWVPNFGANLQALATTLHLESLGHEVVLIDYRPKDMVSRYKRIVAENQNHTHENFLKTHFNVTKEYATYEEMKKDISSYRFDSVLSGSDAVLRLNPKQKEREDMNFPNPFWLDWSFDEEQNIKSRGFVSVSNMGSDYRLLSSESRAGIKELTKRLKMVAVRDGWTKKSLLEINPSLQIEEYVDPVFVLKDYIEHPETKSEPPYILFSLYKNTLSNSWIKSFVKQANQVGYRVLYLPHPEGEKIDTSYFDESIQLPLGPLDWFNLIRKSSGYVGVRFHPIVICLANSVPFVSLDTYQTSIFNPGISKTYDICKKLNSSKYCYGKIKMKIASPKKVLNALTSKERREVIADYSSRLEEEALRFKDYLKSIVEED